MNNHIFHVIKDPVHGTMQFTSTEDAWIKPFVDSANFQRLRQIKQLGLGDLIFPGAVHSRFNHCIGCCYVGSQIAQKIGLADEERQLVMIACLLHDIGHGPFSHTFEDLFTNKLIHHEDWTTYFLADYVTDAFFTAYNQGNPRHQMSEEKFTDIANMIMHKPVRKQLLADIVSSQLDADRLDYLLRDSHFCGVRYGEFDFRWMLHCLAIVASPKGERLGITHKGIGVVEHYLMARRLMMRNIYHGQKKLAIEMLLVELLARLAQVIEVDALFAPLIQSRLGQFLIATHHFNVLIPQLNAADIKQQKAAFLAQNFTNYKELCDYDVYALIRQLAEFESTHEVVEIAKRLQARQMPKIVRLEHTDLALSKQILSDFKQKNDFYDWQLFLTETPHQAYSEEDPILVINQQSMIKPIGNFSMMLNAISDKLEHTFFLAIDAPIANDARVKKLTQELARASLQNFEGVK